MEEWIAVRVVQVEFRRQETRDNQEEGRNRGLQRERTPIVADSTQSPKKNQGQADVEG